MVINVKLLIHEGLTIVIDRYCDKQKNTQKQNMLSYMRVVVDRAVPYPRQYWSIGLFTTGQKRPRGYDW